MIYFYWVCPRLKIFLLFLLLMKGMVDGIGVNWGMQSAHPLLPSTVVRMLQDNGFRKVKLFDASPSILDTLGRSGIQVMVGIPNNMLSTLSRSVKAAGDWVAKNVSRHIASGGIDIRLVVVGNEPFLSTYNGSFLNTTLPALQNIQSAILKDGLGTQVKVTVPLNADVYESPINRPSDGDFRPDINALMVQIVQFLSDNGAPFTVYIYPFISLYNNRDFPFDFAFFDNSFTTLDDNGNIYTDVFDANHDMLVSALQKHGFENMSIVVGEIGWPTDRDKNANLQNAPTDGDKNANLQNAQRFSQEFKSPYSAGTGTPLRPGPMDVYLFSLIDEDAKSFQPGNFERHWGLFYFNGQPKYNLNLGTTNSTKNLLVAAKGIQCMAQRWCVMSPSASLADPQVAPSVSYTYANADCTSLGYMTSCGNLTDSQNISYAFNNYYQQNNQLNSACKFPDNLSIITMQNPSTGGCNFTIMISTHYSSALSSDATDNYCFPRRAISLAALLSYFLDMIL